LKIPNSALRFKPTLPDTQLDEAFRKAGEEKFWSVLKKSYRLPAPAPLPSSASMGGTRGGQLLRDSGMSAKSVIRGKRVPLWVLDNDISLRPIVAQLGLTDGMSTQIEDGKLKQGDRIIIGYEFDPNRPTPAAGSRPPGFGGPFMGGFRR
jgi:hypothetical protein